MEVKEKIDLSDLKVAFAAMSSRDLRRANFIFTLINYPIITEVGKAMTRVALAMRLPVNGIIRKTIFNHFCGGISIEDCQKTIDELRMFGVGTILDYSAEGEESDEGFTKTKNEILNIIERSKVQRSIPFSVFKMTGLAGAELLEAASSEPPLSSEQQTEYDKLQSRIDEICSAAAQIQLPIMIDAEESWIQEAIDEMALSMMRKYNVTETLVYNTYQMYRTDSLKRLMEDHQSMRKKGLKFGAKLVRGAYMEKERERAEDLGYQSPIHETKQLTDECFDAGIRYCCENAEDISVVCGSHNERSNIFMTELMKELDYSEGHPHFWYAQLYGMSDNISFNLAKAGYNVTKYVPYGPVRSVMPYLFRRAEENTSVAGQSSRELQMIRKEIKRRKAETTSRE